MEQAGAEQCQAQSVKFILTLKYITLVLFQYIFQQARLSWATLEFQVKVRSKYGCANVRLLKGL